MASLEHDAASGRFRLRFGYGGRPHKRSLTTTDEAEARAVLGRVEKTIRLIERGRLVMPPDADPGSFILSDGKLNGKLAPPKAVTLSELFKLYRTELGSGAKEPSTLEGEGTHIKHILRHLKPPTVVQTLTVSDLQGYVDKRLRDKWHGKVIRPDTIKKEVTTLRLIWNWAADQGYLVGPAPTSGLKYPKIDQKPPFMTLEQIQRIIDRGGLNANQIDELWDSLFLAVVQAQEVRDHVLEHARHDFIFPMFVFAAHTGARRSEIVRSRIDDFDFDARMALVREKKKSREKSLTYRKLPMTDLLVDTMTNWFSKHPGGPSFQYPKTILGNPDNVVLAVPNRM